jgi:hypothetical protein
MNTNVYSSSPATSVNYSLVTNCAYQNTYNYPSLTEQQAQAQVISLASEVSRLKAELAAIHLERRCLITGRSRKFDLT